MMMMTNLSLVSNCTAQVKFALKDKFAHCCVVLPATVAITDWSRHATGFIAVFLVAPTSHFVHKLLATHLTDIYHCFNTH